ncbi:MAG: hypothetical protein R3F61_06820 [Myxococcota bacterium]
MRTHSIHPLARAAAVLLFAALCAPQAFSDVAVSEGVLTKTAEESCPPPEEVALEDLDILFECQATGVRSLFSETETECYYALEDTCGGGASQRGCGG